MSLKSVPILIPHCPSCSESASARDAVVLHIRANAVYHLPGDGVVARIRFARADQDAIVERATGEAPLE